MGKVIYFHAFNIGGNIMKYKITDVANELLQFEKMTHKKLQKLCYYVQALHLAIYDEPLINTYFEAWVHGPVSPELYEKYKGKGMDPIERDKDCNYDIQQEKKDFIKMIYDIYGELTAYQLEKLTHTEDPWLNAREDYGVYDICNNTIKDEDMKEYYKDKLMRIINEKSNGYIK